MNVFDTIAAFQPKLPGWCTPEKAEALAAIVLATRPSVSVEIGIYGGSSFIPIALAHKHVGIGMAVGIDPWSAQASVIGETPENQKWWAEQDYEKLYNDFLQVLNNLGLNDWVRIVRQTSDQAQPPNVIDLLHIDGSHTDQAVKDVVRYAAKVRPGGICFMDDLEWVTGGVRRAEARLLQLGFRKLYAMSTGAVYQRA